MVGNNTPIFFMRDPQKFVDFSHTQRRNPKSNLRDPSAYWDFFSQLPESAHQVTFLFTDRGTPDGYRHMHGFGTHTFRWVNAQGEAFWVKFHFLTDSGVKNFTIEEANKMRGIDPDYATNDLYNHIAAGKTATWTWKIQVMPEADGYNYKWNIFDPTKVWPHGDYPLIEVGKLTLNKNPENFFAETEQSAFAPANFVPGIEPSPDRVLQGRLFAYSDTQRYRLGVNHQQLPINCPYRTKVANGQRDGFMTHGLQGSKPIYNSEAYGTYKEDKKYAQSTYKVSFPSRICLMLY